MKNSPHRLDHERRKAVRSAQKEAQEKNTPQNTEKKDSEPSKDESQLKP